VFTHDGFFSTSDSIALLNDSTHGAMSSLGRAARPQLPGHEKASKTGRPSQALIIKELKKKELLPFKISAHERAKTLAP
jgi:hypothetical protein